MNLQPPAETHSVGSIRSFMASVVVWLPIMFFCWYSLAVLLTLPLHLALDALLPWIFPQVVEVIEQNGHLLDVVTRFSLPATAGFSPPAGQVGLLVFTVNPLVYGYGLPLYGALLLAAPGTEGEKWRNAMVGFLALYAVQFWGVFFEMLKTLLFGLGPEATAEMAFSALSLELVAWTYQFGYLILPTVSPLMLWLWLHRAFVASLTIDLNCPEQPGLPGR